MEELRRLEEAKRGLFDDAGGVPYSDGMAVAYREPTTPQLPPRVRYI